MILCTFLCWLKFSIKNLNMSWDYITCNWRKEFMLWAWGNSYRLITCDATNAVFHIFQWQRLLFKIAKIHTVQCVICLMGNERWLAFELKDEMIWHIQYIYSGMNFLALLSSSKISINNHGHNIFITCSIGKIYVVRGFKMLFKKVF